MSKRFSITALGISAMIMVFAAVVDTLVTSIEHYPDGILLTVIQLWIYISMFIYAPLLGIFGIDSIYAFKFYLQLFAFYVVLLHILYIIKAKFGTKGFVFTLIPIVLIWIAVWLFILYILVNWTG